VATEVIMLPQPIRSVLADLATRLDLAGIPYVLGGSAMLQLSGLDVTVGDLDILVDGSSRHAIESMLADYREPQSTDPWRSQWFLRSEWSAAGASLPVDVIGDMALMIDGEAVFFPFDVERFADIGEARVPLAPLRQWYHLYRVHDPAKAILIAKQLTDDEIMTGAAELGIDGTFSPTLIVRIGNDSPTTEIEEDMSDVQSSIIEVASPTDQTFDEPGTEIIDLDLLNETLEYVRPALQADGGDLILLGTEGGKVSLQLVGACGGCPLSTMTLTSGIERILQDRVPGVTSVVSV
jgi:Fe-S cluster biogenesis protein NfuA